MAEKTGVPFYGSVEEYVSARGGNRAIKKVSCVAILWCCVSLACLALLCCPGCGCIRLVVEKGLGVMDCYFSRVSCLLRLIIAIYVAPLLRSTHVVGDKLLGINMESVVQCGVLCNFGRWMICAPTCVMATALQHESTGTRGTEERSCLVEA